MTKKQRIKQCGLCKEAIDLDKDNYCQLIDYLNGKFYGEGYYHTKCYHEKMTSRSEMKLMKRAAWNLLGKANKQLGDSGMEVEV